VHDGWLAGVYDEKMLVAMDRLLVECSKRGLRLLPTLTNYWQEFGGMQQYVRCATRTAGDKAWPQFITNMHHRYVELRSSSLLRSRVTYWWWGSP
jgi:endo-1,4-beta-mannosidase